MPFFSNQASLASMEANWFNILIEVGFFLFLALLYYLFQKKRIIRADINDVFHKLEKLTYDLNHFLDSSTDQQLVKDSNKVLDELEREEITLPEIKQLLENLPANLPTEILQFRDEVIEQLNFHCK